MPTNVYGENDKFDAIDGHVIPAMIKKIENAKKGNKFVKPLGLEVLENLYILMT